MVEIAFDVLKFLDDYEISYQSSGKNVSRGWVELNCPFCDDPSSHLGINLDSKLHHCWICSAKGGPVKLVKAITKCTWEQAKLIVKKYTDWTLVELLDEDILPKKLKWPSEFVLLTPNTIPQLVSEYLTQRNFKPEEITRKYQLYYPGPLGTYKLRMVVPILQRNKVVNFVCRDVTGKTSTRYKNCPNEEAGVLLNSLLYGIEEIPEGKPIVLVEGIFDKWRLGYGAVGTFGTNVTSEQALILQSKKPSKIFIMLDSDMPEEKYAKIAGKLWFTNVEMVNLDFEGDPSDLPPSDARSIMKELLNGLDSTEEINQR